MLPVYLLPMLPAAQSLVSWLSRNRDAIEAGSALLQGAAVVLGVAVAINEFVIKDRDALRSRMESTGALLASVDSLRTVLDSLYGEYQRMPVGGARDQIAVRESDIALGYDRIRYRTAAMYSRIEACVSTGACDSELAERYFCATAVHDALLHTYATAPAPSVNPSDLSVNLFHFAARCFPNCYLLKGQPEWVDEYAKLYPQRAVVRSGRLHRSPAPSSACGER